jgi:hypothetical protein
MDTLNVSGNNVGTLTAYILNKDACNAFLHRIMC